MYLYLDDTREIRALSINHTGYGILYDRDGILADLVDRHPRIVFFNGGAGAGFYVTEFHVFKQVQAEIATFERGIWKANREVENRRKRLAPLRPRASLSAQVYNFPPLEKDIVNV